VNECSTKKIIDRRAQDADTSAQNGGPWTKNGTISYCITNLRIPFFEVDVGRAVYHGNYFHFFELGREDFLKKTGFSYQEFMNRQLHLTITDLRCKYRKSLHYEDEIEVHTGIILLGRRNISFSQLIYRPAEVCSDHETRGFKLELCTESQIDMVCVKFTGQSTFLPEDFLKAVKGEH